MSTALTVQPATKPISVFADEAQFEVALRLVKPLISSGLVPQLYRGDTGMGNALIALDMANRMGVPALMVMQNLNIIEGKPAWGSKFVIAALNSCGLFSPIRWKIKDLGEVEAERAEWSGPKDNRQKKITKTKIRDKEYIAYATEKATGEILEGPPVTFSMAVAEGWYFRAGSKWLTMPDLMGRYRSASFFAGLYAAHILNGMPTQEEIVDISEPRDITPAPEQPAAKVETEKPAGRPRGIHAAMNKKADPAKTEAKQEAKVIDAEVGAGGAAAGTDAQIVVKTQTDDGDPGLDGDDVPFGDPDDDDDFNPA